MRPLGVDEVREYRGERGQAFSFPAKKKGVDHMTPTRTEDTKAKEQLKGQLSAVKEDLGEMGHLVASAATETVDEAKDKARDFLEEKRDKTRELEDVLIKRVRERPLESVAIAAGVGLLLGILSRR